MLTETRSRPLKRLVQSLRFKVSVGIVVPMIAIMGLFSYLQYVMHREVLLDHLEHANLHVSEAIESSLRYAMMTKDLTVLQQIVDDIAEQDGIEGLFLINKQGEILLAPQQTAMGAPLRLDDPDCQVCHGPAPATGRGEATISEKSSIVRSLNGGQQVLRIYSPIGQPVQAHLSDSLMQPASAVLVIDFKLSEVDDHLAQDRQHILALSASAIGLVVVVVVLSMNHLVLSRLLQVVTAIRRFGAGHLDQRVTTETGDELGELGASFNVMADELIRLYDEMKQKDIWRRRLLRKVITAQEEERKRIARELHDDLAQTLAALTVTLKMTIEALPPELAHPRAQLDTAHGLTEQVLEQIREWILDLRPAMLDDLGLVPAIRRFAEFRLEAQGARLEFQTQGVKRRLGSETETAFFRILQEAINNIAKHASARQVSVKLEFDDDRVSGFVEDDGQGFDAEAILRHQNGSQGLGLLGMRERAVLLGGTVTVASELGRGTRITVQIPLEKGIQEFEEHEQDSHPIG